MAGFPVESISVITQECSRFALRVAQRMHAQVNISHGGVFSCRPIAGSTTWSQHSWGNAVDLFIKSPENLPPHVSEKEARKQVFEAAVRQATRKTLANRGRKVNIAHVINHADGIQWSPELGYHPYSGTSDPHIHVDFQPNRTGRPPCAGG